MKKKIFKILKTIVSIYGFIVTLILFGILIWYIVKIPELLNLLQSHYKLSGSMRGAIVPIQLIFLTFATGLLSAAISCIFALLPPKRQKFFSEAGGEVAQN